MGSSGTFVYILEADAILSILSEWPARMQVAVCLTPDGACDLAVHHENEVARVLHRIAALQSDVALSVAPEVAGYPTRKVLFSEEQQLLSLVADSSDLAEIASDYAINYRFAQEQGLDSNYVTETRAAQPKTLLEPAHREQGAAAPTSLSARSQAFLTHLFLPSGYAAPSLAQKPECLFVGARLERVGDCLRLHLASDGSVAEAHRVNVTRIGFRDDYARFVLPRGALDGWAVGQAACLDLPEDLFPEAAIARYMQAPDACQVTVTGRGIFVSPASQLAAPTLPVAVVAPVKPRRRLIGRVHMAVGALVAVMLVTSHFAAALDWAPDPDRARNSAGEDFFTGANAQTVPSSDADVAGALGLLMAMTREETGQADR